MTYVLLAADPVNIEADAVVIGVLQGADGPIPAPYGVPISDEVSAKLGTYFETLGVKGKAGEVVRIPTGDEITAPLLIAVGLGKEATATSLQRAAGAAARATGKATKIALALPAATADDVKAITSGHILGSYSYDGYKKPDENPKPEPTITVVVNDADEAESLAAFDEAKIEATAVAAIRDWVNTPPADLTPPAFANEVALAASAIEGVTVTVHDEASLAELGCGGILGVGAGSDAPPRLVELVYSPPNPVAHIALVGKGITFDTGGYTLKPGNSMNTMKSDMAGAATVVQATLVAAQLGLPVKVSTFAPMAENMVSGHAMRPGDILSMYGGKTVEVTNTDAEGRLILADAIVRATEVAPDAIIDVATLTGAMIVALGDKITGVMGSDDVVADVLAAAECVGEEMWPMPIPEPIVERVRASKIADVLQSDWIRWGGGLYAAAFLAEFTEELPWAHLDIAGPSWHGGGASGHLTPGGTGAALTTLVNYIRTRSAKM